MTKPKYLSVKDKHDDEEIAYHENHTWESYALSGDASTMDWEQTCKGHADNDKYNLAHQHWRCATCKQGTGMTEWQMCPYEEEGDLIHIVMAARLEVDNA